jgi:hypothetical protein
MNDQRQEDENFLSSEAWDHLVIPQPAIISLLALGIVALARRRRAGNHA